MNWKNNIGRSQLGILVFVLVIGYMAYQFVAIENPNPTPASPETITQKIVKPTYASRAVDNSWPEINSEKTGLGMGQNILTENFYIVLDGSGSMEEKKCSGNTSKMLAATRALSGFVKNIPADSNVGLAIFVKGQLRELAPLQPAGQLDIDRLVTGLKPTGSTPLYSAISFAYRKLTIQGQKQLGYGRYHLIIITDGIASEGQNPTAILDEILDKSPVNLHAIGFCIGKNHVLNQPGLLIYHAADSPQQLSKGLESVLAESPHFDLSKFKD